MSRFSDYQPPAIVEQQKQSKFICSACGAGRDCDCKAFALKRVIEYDQANPGQSERQAAADLGIPKTTVHEARGRTRPPDAEAPATVTGRDGKTYPAAKHRDEPAIRPELSRLIVQANKHLDRIIPLIRQMEPHERILFRTTALQKMAEVATHAPKKEEDIIEF